MDEPVTVLSNKSTNSDTSDVVSGEYVTAVSVSEVSEVTFLETDVSDMDKTTELHTAQESTSFTESDNGLVTPISTEDSETDLESRSEASRKFPASEFTSSDLSDSQVKSNKDTDSTDSCDDSHPELCSSTSNKPATDEDADATITAAKGSPKPAGSEEHQQSEKAKSLLKKMESVRKGASKKLKGYHVA